MKSLESRTTPLSPKEISDFLDDHLRYRIKILDTLNSYSNRENLDPYWPSIYESAQIVCRMFIEFFGLKVMGNPSKLKENSRYYSKDGITSYEVKIKDLGSDFIRLKDLTLAEQELLAHAYESGNTATAHLTYGSSFIAEPQKVIAASLIIKRIIKEKFDF